MSEHDYTAEDFANPDDFLIGDVTAGDKSADQIEAENYFAPVPPGEQRLVVVGFTGAPQNGYHKVFVNGQLVGFNAYSVGVKLGMPGAPKRTVTDFFTLPPDNPRDLNAYYYGVPESREKPGTPSTLQPGVDGNRFSHFINRLGFNFPPGGKLPPEAQKLGNWKGREIVATVIAGTGTYTGRDGKERPRDSKVKWFSYKPAGTPIAPAASAGQPSSRPAARPAPAMAGASVNGAGANEANGLDDI